MPALDAMSAHPGYQLGRTPRHGREEREWETLNASVKTGLWNEWGTSGALEQGARRKLMEGWERQRVSLGGQPEGGDLGEESVMKPLVSGYISTESHSLNPDLLWARLSFLTEPPSRAAAWLPLQSAKPGRGGGGGHISLLGHSADALSISDAFRRAHLPVSVFMFSSLTLAVWSTSLRKYLLLKVVAITTTSLHARPSISEMQNLSLKACAAHQRGIGAHYFYIILQANRYFPIHISFLS